MNMHVAVILVRLLITLDRLGSAQSDSLALDTDFIVAAFRFIDSTSNITHNVEASNSVLEETIFDGDAIEGKLSLHANDSCYFKLKMLGTYDISLIRLTWSPNDPLKLTDSWITYYDIYNLEWSNSSVVSLNQDSAVNSGLNVYLQYVETTTIFSTDEIEMKFTFNSTIGIELTLLEIEGNSFTFSPTILPTFDPSFEPTYSPTVS